MDIENRRKLIDEPRRRRTKPHGIVSLVDIERLEAEMPFEARLGQRGVWRLLEANAARHAARPAISFLPNGLPDEPTVTVSASST